MKDYLKDYFVFYRKYVLIPSSIVIAFTVIVLLFIRRLSIETLLNVMFAEGSVFMLLSGIMAMFRLSRMNFKASIGKNRIFIIAYSWFLFSISFTIFVTLYLIHLISRFFI